MWEGYLKTEWGINPNGGGVETIQVRAIPLSKREGYLKTEVRLALIKRGGGVVGNYSSKGYSF